MLCYLCYICYLCYLCYLCIAFNSSVFLETIFIADIKLKKTNTNRGKCGLDGIVKRSLEQSTQS